MYFSSIDLENAFDQMTEHFNRSAWLRLYSQCTGILKIMSKIMVP